MNIDITDAVTTFEGAKDPVALGRGLAKIIDRWGFRHFAYIALRFPGGLRKPYAITNYPDAWHVHYSSHSYINFDPVVAASLQGMRPLRWGTSQIEPRWGRGDKRIFDEASDFGITNGITVPIHGQGMEYATLSVASDMRTKEFNKIWKAHRYDLHLIALYYHQAVKEKIQLESDAAPLRLSPRERECLLWTARGKTAWETSEILSVSEATVIFHVTNAARKLGVYSKHHAVVKAILLGFIYP